MSKLQSWQTLASIQIGGAICLPVILIGVVLTQNYGLLSALVAIGLGNLFLVVLGLVTVKMGSKSRKSTVENAKLFLGEKGGKLLALMMILSMTGWFAIQLNLMSLSVVDLFGLDPGHLLYVNTLIGCVIVLFALRGIKALGFLSHLTVPLMAVTLGYLALKKGGAMAETLPGFSLGGVSLVIAAGIAGVIDLPTYFRHAKSEKHGQIALVLLFGLAIPLVECVGVVLAARCSGSILEVLQGDGGSLWRIWVALFLVMAGWTTNNTNLYSSAVSLATLLPKIGERSRILLLGGVGTLLASLNLLARFERTLDLIGVGIGSVGAVVLTRYLSKNEISEWMILIFCLAGAVLGIVTSLGGIRLTSVPVLDAFVAGVLLTFLGGWKNEKVIEERS